MILEKRHLERVFFLLSKREKLIDKSRNFSHVSTLVFVNFYSRVAKKLTSQIKPRGDKFVIWF